MGRGNGIVTFLRRLVASALAFACPLAMTTYLSFIELPIEYWQIAAVSAVLGLGFTIFWTVREEKLDSERVDNVLQVTVRFLLVFIFINYGIAKLVRSQFGPQLLSYYDAPAWELSGFRLTWVYYSFSHAFVSFIGLAQIAGGLLLAFRRTVTAGVLVLLPIISNIVIINYVYGVPVKFLSTLFLVMILYLGLRDAGRLKAFFWDNAAHDPKPFPTLRPRTARLGNVVKALFIVFAFSYSCWRLGTSMKQFLGESPLYGAWQVETYQSGGETYTDQLGGRGHWQKVYFEKGFQGNGVMVKTPSGKELATMSLDQEAGTIELAFRDDAEGEPSFKGRYRREANERLVLMGTLGAHEVRIELRKIDLHFSNAIP